MLAWLALPDTMVFGVALMLMFLLFLVEIIALLVGGANDWLDGVLPDDLHAQPEMGLEVADAGVLVRFLSWLYVGRVPLLMWLVLFLTVFGLVGYGFQAACQHLLGFTLPMIAATLLVGVMILPVVRVLAAGLYRVLPKDETTAIHSSALIGRVGEIVLGTATPTAAAQVKVKDKHGQTHYVMTYADQDDLAQGEQVLLISQNGASFRAIKNVNPNLVD